MVLKEELGLGSSAGEMVAVVVVGLVVEKVVDAPGVSDGDSMSPLVLSA